MLKSPLPLACLAALVLAGCGSGDESAASVEGVTAVDAALARTTPPPPSAVVGALAKLPDTAEGRRRIGYVNLQALEAFGGSLSPVSVERRVLGAGSADAPAGATTLIQIGGATIADGATPRVLGGSAAERERFADTTPQENPVTEETPSAVVSCLGDGAAQVIVGPGALGYRAGVGAGLLSDDNAPAGRKLMICAAPHYFRQLEMIIGRIERAFPAADFPAGAQPVITEQDMGERDIVTASIPLDGLPASRVLELLAGGSALTSLVRE